MAGKYATARAALHICLVFLALKMVASVDTTVHIQRETALWNRQLQAMLLPVFQQTSLDCAVTNKPWSSSVRWVKQSPDSHIFVPIEEGISQASPSLWRLSFTPHPLEDGWRFICNVQTGAQFYVRDEVLVRVVDPPVIAQLVSSNDMEARVGDAVSLKCDARALPPANFTWSRVDGQPINGSLEVQGKQLVIPTVTLTDAGQYKCLAENLVGQAERIITVTVNAGR